MTLESTPSPGAHPLPSPSPTATTSPFSPLTAWLTPLGLALVAFYYLIGPRILLPDNLAWLNQSGNAGDGITHYLGWAYFRHSPWSFPVIGANPDYGLEFGSSIVYSDSNPLLAVFFKLIEQALPTPFQYVGYWYLLCLVMQALVAWKLLGKLSNDRVQITLGTALLLFSPPLMLRLSVNHENLCAHFVVLAALYLYLFTAGAKASRRWCLLNLVAFAVHIYLFAIIAPLWLASIWQRQRAGDSSRQLIVETVFTFAACLLLAWLFGVFTIDNARFMSAEYGRYSSAIDTLINNMGFTRLSPARPNANQTSYEGFNYLGAGGIVLVLLGIVFFRKRVGSLRSCLPRLRPLGLALAGLWLFATSHQLYFNNRLLLTLPLPEALLNAATIFRASGRFYWPIYYAVWLAILWVICRDPKPRRASAWLALALTLQFVDFYSLNQHTRQIFMAEPSPQLTSRLRSDFWQQASRQYRQIVTVNNLESLDQWLIQTWRDIAITAQRYRMPTNAAYLARYPSRSIERHLRDGLTALHSGQYQADSLYLLAPDLKAIALQTLQRDRDKLLMVDGMLVVAPNWFGGEAIGATPLH